MKSIALLVGLILSAALCPCAWATPSGAQIGTTITASGPEMWLGDSGYETLNTAITTIGSTQIALRLRSGAYTFTGNLSIPANITLKPERGAVITVAAGQTLTINGWFDAEWSQAFACAGTGKVIFTGGSVAEVYPEWWANNTVPGTTDMSAAIQAAIDCRGMLGSGAEPRWPVVKFAASDYRINTTLNLTNTRVAGTVQRDGVHLQGTSYFTGTRLIGNTGNLVIDASGIAYFRITDLTITTTVAGLSNPSVVGILQARNTTLSQSQFNHFKNLTIVMHDNATANGNNGTVAIMNYQAESVTYDTCWFEANRPATFTISEAYLYGVKSVYQTLPVYGATSSMTGIHFAGNNVLRTVARRSPALVLAGAAVVSFVGEIMNHGTGGTNDYAIHIPVAVQTFTFIGAVENLGTLFRLDAALVNADIRANLANPTNSSAPLISILADAGYLLECDLGLNLSNEPARNLITTTAPTRSYCRNTRIKTNLAAARAISSLDSGLVNYSAGKNFVVECADGWFDSNSRWLDYTTGAAVTGFSVLTGNKVWYKIVGGDEVHILFEFVGTSNAATLTFTLPFAPASSPAHIRSLSVNVVDNGVDLAPPGLIALTAGSTTATIYQDGAATAFTKANGKSAIGQIIYRK